MSRVGTRRIFISAVCLLLFSCSFEHAGDRLLAQVGEYELYDSDVKSIYKRGMSKADSLSSMRLFIDGWIREKILLSNAEAALSPEEQDVSAELESYRASLLIYRYENRFIESHLDSHIPESVLETYYSENEKDFVGTETVVRVRCILIDSDSPNFKRIERLYQSSDAEEYEDLTELCRSSAEIYEDFGMNWVGMSKVALFLRTSTSEAEAIFSAADSYRSDVGGKTLLVHVFDKVRRGRRLPFDYVRNDIRGVMLNRKRAELLEEFRKKEWRDSYGSSRIKIYLNDEN